jgi:hypothetical protein
MYSRRGGVLMRERERERERKERERERENKSMHEQILSFQTF